MSTIAVNVLNFNRAESDLMFARLAAGVGLGAWNHTRDLGSLDNQPIIRQNRDTLYSSAIIDVRENVTITVPDTGERYISVWVVSQDHFGPVILRDPGEHLLTRELVGTDYAALIVRILVDPNSPEDVAEVNRLQDALNIDGGGTGEFPVARLRRAIADRDPRRTPRTRAWHHHVRPFIRYRCGSRSDQAPARYRHPAGVAFPSTRPPTSTSTNVSRSGNTVSA